LASGSVGLEVVSGPVGIVNGVREAAQRGPEVVLVLAGFITAQLGMLNLLPWPGLDGGRLVLLGVEVLRRGRRLPATQEGAINFLGIVLLLVLVALVTVDDVRRIAGG
jgi:regulator of sigma E protease